MVNGHYTKYNIQLFMCEITQKYTSYDKIGTLFWHRVMVCYVHKASLTVDHCTQNEQHTLVHLRYITTMYTPKCMI